MSSKFNLYTLIHKAIRKEMFEVCVLAGITDFSDHKLHAIFLEKFNSLLDLLRKHSINEDTFIHPLLAEKNLPEFDLIKNDHEELEEQLWHLEQLLEQVINSKDNVMTLESGNKFYLAFSQFVSNYLQHLLLEETKIMDTLNAHYELSDLLQAMEKFKKAQSQEEAAKSLKLMSVAINPEEAKQVGLR